MLLAETDSETGEGCGGAVVGVGGGLVGVAVGGTVVAVAVGVAAAAVVGAAVGEVAAADGVALAAPVALGEREAWAEADAAGEVAVSSWELESSSSPPQADTSRTAQVVIASISNGFIGNYYGRQPWRDAFGKPTFSGACAGVQ